VRTYLHQFRADVVGDPLGQPLRAALPRRRQDASSRSAYDDMRRKLPDVPDTTTARAANDGQGRAHRAAVMATAQPPKAGDEDVDERVVAMDQSASEQQNRRRSETRSKHVRHAGAGCSEHAASIT
jgi:hypothetical protein